VASFQSFLVSSTFPPSLLSLLPLLSFSFPFLSLPFPCNTASGSGEALEPGRKMISDALKF